MGKRLKLAQTINDNDMELKVQKNGNETLPSTTNSPNQPQTGSAKKDRSYAHNVQQSQVSQLSQTNQSSDNNPKHQNQLTPIGDVAESTNYELSSADKSKSEEVKSKESNK